MIGGNITATIRVKSSNGKNAIGEGIESWNDVGTVLGWLDYQAGQNGIQQLNAKIQDTTHFFMCDYFRWKLATQDAEVTSENCKLILNGEIYNVLMIDDPMNLHQHIEVFLQYVGGGLGV
jgi:head-tail adaptor